MSFYDEGDEPTRVSSRPSTPRRPATASRPAGGRPDRQTVLVRQAIALGVGVLLLILIVLGVRGCVDSRRETALKDYNREVTAVISDSDNSVGKPFFELLSNGARDANDLQVQVNQLRLAADEDVKRADGLDVPGAMRNAQDNLMLVLNLRAEALRKIAEQIPSALGRGQRADNATNVIAGEMEAFLASDVVYKLRVAPHIKQALDDEGIAGQTISNSQFLDSLTWLSPATVASALGREGGGTGASQPAPGLHGHGLVSTSVGDTVLQPGTTLNRVPAAGNIAFRVKFANQGDNDERNVKVSVTVRGSGIKPVTRQKTIGQTKSKTESEVSIPLGQAPPIGQAVTVETVIARAPGEENVDNNRASYTVIFTR